MLKKILLSILALATIVIGGGFAFLSLRSPSMAPASAKKVASTPERIERGRYLFATAGCETCHSQLDETRFATPVIEGGYAKGQPVPGPGKIIAPNLTSDAETGAARFSDGQLIRAIREGIGHDDRVLFPIMPFTEYCNLSDEDVESLVAYIRTIPPVRNPLPKTEVMFPVNLFVKSYPKPVGSVAPLDRADKVTYGRHLTRISGCHFCHTPTKNNVPIEEQAFSGGHPFKLTATARAISPNLTPDAETGLGKWSEQQFLEKFAEYKTYAQNGSPKIEPELNTSMPWISFARYSDDDLRAIYAYLRTVPAITNGVVTHPDAPEEKSKKK